MVWVAPAHYYYYGRWTRSFKLVWGAPVLCIWTKSFKLNGVRLHSAGGQSPLSSYGVRLHCAGRQSPLSGVWFVVCPCVGGRSLLSTLLFGVAVGRRHVVGIFYASKRQQQLVTKKKDPGPLTPSLNNVHHKFSLFTPTADHHLLPVRSFVIVI